MNRDSNYRVYKPYIIEGQWYREGLNIGTSKCSGRDTGSRAIDNLKERIKELEKLLIEHNDVRAKSGVWTTGVDGDVITITLSNGETFDIRRGVVSYLIQTINDSSNLNGGSTSGGGTFGDRTNITITATPNDGNEFEGWYVSGKKVSSEPSYNVEVTKNITYTAKFIKKTYTITIPSNPDADIVATLNGQPVTLNTPITINHGDRLTLRATPKKGKNFVKWLGVPNEPTSREITIPITDSLNIRPDMGTLKAHISVIGQTQDQGEYVNGLTTVDGDAGATYNISLSAKEGYYISSVNSEVIDALTYNKTLTFPGAGETLQVLVSTGQLTTATITSPVPVVGARKGSDNKYYIDGIPNKTVSVTLDTTGYRLKTIDYGTGRGPQSLTSNTISLTITPNTQISIGAELDLNATINTPSGTIKSPISGGSTTFNMVVPVDKELKGFRIGDTNKEYTKNGNSFTISGLEGNPMIEPVLEQLYKVKVSPGTTEASGKDLNAYYKVGTTLSLVPPAQGPGISWTWKDGSTDNPKSVVVGGGVDMSIITSDNRPIPTLFQFFADKNKHPFDEDYTRFTIKDAHELGSRGQDSGKVEYKWIRSGTTKPQFKIVAMKDGYNIDKIDVEFQGDFKPLRILDKRKLGEWYRIEFDYNNEHYKGIIFDTYADKSHDIESRIKVTYSKS